jgi:hypothetical protein
MGGPGSVLTGMRPNLRTGLVFLLAAMSSQQSGKRREYRLLSLSAFPLECYAPHHPRVFIDLISMVQHLILLAENALFRGSKQCICHTFARWAFARLIGVGNQDSAKR